jgi:GT2 family glycosyltransferase
MSKQPGMKIPEVSIVILNWNKSALTLKCLKGIRSNATANSCEIIIVDNGSTPLELAHLKAGLDTSCVLISLDRNMFFGGGCNVGAKAARGKFLLFLNNDVLITPGSVDGLVALYKSSFSPGAIGPKFLYPNGLLQEAGAFVLSSGRSFQQGKGGIEPDRHFARGVHIVDYCSAACLLVERDTFMKHGGFDPIFEPAYFEDADLCFRLRAKGLYTYYASDVSVYHEENATSAVLWSHEEILAIVAKNSLKFMQRWSTYLESRLKGAGQPSGLDVGSSAPSASMGNILLRSATILDDSTDCAAMLRCAAALETRYEITLAAPEIYSRPRINALCRELGLRLNKYKTAKLADTDGSLYDHVISFPDSAFGEDPPLSNLNCMRMLFDTL